MDNQRLIVWVAFGLLAFMTYQQWLKDYSPQPQAESGTQATEEAPATGSLPALPSAADEEIPTLPAATDSVPAVGEPQAAPATLITVETDVLSLAINPRGGRLEKAFLKNYPVTKDRPDELVQLLSADANDLATLQAGLITAGANGGDYFNATLTSEQMRYDMGGAEQLEVVLRWDNGAGVAVDKVIALTKGSYRIDVQHVVRNNSEATWSAADYTLLKRSALPQERSMFDVDTYSFDGPIIFNGSNSEKLDRDDLLDAPVSLRAQNGWVAGIQHHFLRAIVPPTDTNYTLGVEIKNNISTASALSAAAVAVQPGTEHIFTNTLFVGPKLQSQLADVSSSLKLTVDYGFLTILSNPLFWLLSKIFEYVANWGVAIILVTVIIKILFYKLTEKSGRSMAKMRELQPRLKAIQERYADDKPAQSQAMMDLYKREKVNPAAGCLPILIQMPFFLAFYWVLLESVEMRQAPFALWITDLSSKDPYFILPLIMGAAMLFQQKLNPAPTDPVQAKVMQIMPIMFTVFFAFFPSGLVLYWVTNTVLSIAQQWHVNKVVEEEQRAKKGKGKKKKE